MPEKAATGRNLYRVSWIEAYLAFRVESGKEHLALMPLTSVNTKAASIGGAIKNTQHQKPQFTETGWRVAKVEQYDYDKKAWKVVQELGLNTGYLSRKDRENMGRDYPASGSFQGSATTGILGILAAFAFIAGIAYLTARRT